jgi:diguanylate cyclase (GGDEF)-like protein
MTDLRNRGSRLTRARRLLPRVGGVALACVLLGGAVAAAVSAVQAWRVDDAAARTRNLATMVRGNAAHEQALLRAAHAGSTAAARNAFFVSAQLQAQLVARLQARALPTQRPLIQRMSAAQTAAVVAAARAFGGPGTREVPLKAALHLLGEVRADAAATAADLRVANVRPWPSSTATRLLLADLVLVALLGAALVARAAAAATGLRRGSAPPPHDEVERLRHVARSDNLTGLGNQRAFQDDLRAVMLRRNETGMPFSLLALDLDGLKQVNDRQGHQAGDSYIRNVATAIRESVNGGGTVYRTGGDEFMAILPGIRAWEALSIAHAVQRLSNQRTGRRALSIGITESTSTEGRRLLLHQADLALYEAKRAKLLAVSYHEGLEPRQADAGVVGPSQDQKVLAAALAAAVDVKDAGTRNHSETVAELCAAIGKKLGFEGERLERLRLAGLLHDVGKIGVSDALLLKPGALREEERLAIELHATVGHTILTSAELHHEAVWVLHHHERFDGGGYPAGLAGDAIPLESRIVAVADAFEAMTGARPYRSARTPEQALAELAAHSGTQFDPQCVQALNAVFGGGEVEVAPAAPAVGQPAVASA